MKKLLSFGKVVCCWLLTGWAGTGVLPLYGQGPTVDAGFACRSASIGCITEQVLQQPSGKRVFLGDFQRTGNGLNRRLVRLLPGGNQPDLAFNANIAGVSVASIDYLIGLPNDELLLISTTSMLTAGTIRQNGVLRLTASGVPDASFNMGTGHNSNLYAVAVQPDGKLLLAGSFTQFNGQPCDKLVRVNANGSRDVTFQPVFSPLVDIQSNVAVQSDGKIIVAGFSINGQQQSEATLNRLLPNGNLDTSFSPPVMPPDYGVIDLAVQADGKVLVYFANTGLLGPRGGLMRLLPTGRIDGTFQTGTGFGNSPRGISSRHPMVVEPSGTILVATPTTIFDGQPIEQLMRLLPDGTLDTNFQPTLVQRSDYRRAPSSLQLLANGQILTNTQLFNADGTTDKRFDPPLRDPGTVLATALQPDGKLVVGGVFSEIGGAPAGGIARLNRDGTVDTAFTNAAATNGVVQALAVRPGGGVLVGGAFTVLGGLPRTALGQLLPSGRPDGTFVSAIERSPLYDFRPFVRALAVQADGKVLAGGEFTSLNAGAPFGFRDYLARFQPDGTLDIQFPALTSYYIVNQVLVQPDNKLVVIGRSGGFNQQIGSPTMVERLLPNGQSDPSFVLTPVSSGTQDQAFGGALDAAGRIYLAGYFPQVGSMVTQSVARLLANGMPDRSFSAAVSPGGYATSVALQPNGRLLVGGSFRGGATAAGSIRLLPTGAVDASYNYLAGPSAPVFQTLIQPDGAVVMGGAFTAVSGLPRVALARLLDPNVLSMNIKSRNSTTLQAWPVPAHDVLHLALDAASRPTQAQLLDALGRAVLTQAVGGSAATLNTAALPAGVYVLRVRYASGWATRRIVVE